MNLVKNKKINIVVLFISFAIVLYFILKDNFTQVANNLFKVNAGIFLLGILIFVLSLFIKSLSLAVFVKEYKKGYSVKNSFFLTLIGQFLNGITPFQSGGQPFQIYLLRKEGIRISDSTNVMIKDSFAYQIALIFIGLVAIISNIFFKIVPFESYFNILILIGFIVNLVVLAILFLLCGKKKRLIKVASKVLKFTSKFKVMEKLGFTKEKIKNGLSNFSNGGLSKKDRKNLLIAIVLNICNLTLLYMVPIFVFNSLGISNISLVDVIILTVFITIIGNFIPIPGATGGIEFCFVQLFALLVKDITLVSTAVILWRFTTYFLGMIMGFVALTIKKGAEIKCE